ncbi:DNA polymerase sliding clamp [Nitzschia inconspicua]|uniref:DNA polymerase sliding clamp n=1 Tax=Nitzschia inconspicua TaxID=303405 RepID=A0A9K3LZN0_9STRA|nr:DNA polymerase sliding clamp [Nitzschia inconspicua]
MFEAVLTEGKTFKHIIEAIKDLVGDCNLDCSEEEISIQSMDSAHVSLVAVRLGSEAFSTYRCDRPNSLGISTSNMDKILKMLGDKDSITFKAEDDKPDILTMLFESENDNGAIADFDLKLMDIERDQLGIPDTPYKCTIQMPSSEFQRIARDLQVLGDTCTISCGKEGVRFSVSGAIGNGNILIRANTAEKDEESVVINMNEPVELNFALRYLNFFTKATKLSNTVVISMSPDVPIVVEYPIQDYGHTKFYLAPKIEED